jgi:hypothetical protein
VANVGRFTRRGKDLSGVMANTGFGDLVIHKPGVTIIVPQRCLNTSTESVIKKSFQARLEELTKENANWLEERGVRIVVGL